jgi:hypothetical protein
MYYRYDNVIEMVVHISPTPTEMIHWFFDCYVQASSAKRAVKCDVIRVMKNDFRVQNKKL